MSQRVVIIGGGASGLAAAVTAAREGAQVAVLEHKDRVGKKILMTGNGKCNLTNLSDFHGKYYGQDVNRIYEFLTCFTPQDTIAFFQSMGLYTKEKRDGGIYPVSEQASAVLDVLRTTCAFLHVKILTECEPLKIAPAKKGGTVQYLDAAGSRQQLAYDRLILAAGGAAAPASGSDGSGYRLAKMLGHHIIRPLPALVQLRCEGGFFKALSGVRAQAALALYIDGRECALQEGELQLTDYGISGIPVFQFSRLAARAIAEKKSCQVRINFLPYLSAGELEELRHKEQFGYKTAEEFFSGIVHKKIAVLICKRHQLKPDMHIEEVSQKTFLACLEELLDFEVMVRETNPFENAQVSSGGVPLSEVTDRLESRCSPDVYLSGELLDCDGICGGYNLQWAWTTGVLAGRFAAR